MIEITILFVGMFILLMISLYLSEYDFYSPSFIVCLLFTFSAGLALYATKSWGLPDSMFSPIATWIMLSGTTVFIVFDQITRRLVINKKNKSNDYKNSICYNSKPIHLSALKFLILIIICISGTILYVLAVYRRVKLNGYVGEFNFGRIAQYVHSMSFLDNVKGSTGRAASFMQTAAKIAMYICMYIFTNNVICCQERITSNIKYFTPILTWIPNILITSSRGSYLQVAGAFMFFSYISICRKNRWKKMKDGRNKMIKKASSFFIIVLLAFYTVSSTGIIGRQTEKNFIDTITIYLGAPIIHFHQFILSPVADVDCFGQETFTQMLPTLKKIGFNVETVSGQMEMRTIIGDYRGNVYTFFRRPYHDFGLLGMYIIVAVTAIVFSYVYYKKIYGKYQSYRNDRNLILYAYFYYIIYIFSVDCAIYLYAYIGIVYLLIIFAALYHFVTDNKMIYNHSRD